MCTGPAKRGAAPVSPDLAISIYNERNTFWDLILTETPYATVQEANDLAHKLIDEVNKATHSAAPMNYLTIIHKELTSHIEQMNMAELTLSPDSGLKLLNRLIRVYTRIHVIARQYLAISANH